MCGLAHGIITMGRGIAYNGSCGTIATQIVYVMKPRHARLTITAGVQTSPHHAPDYRFATTIITSAKSVVEAMCGNAGGITNGY